MKKRSLIVFLAFAVVIVLSLASCDSATSADNGAIGDGEPGVFGLSVGRAAAGTMWGDIDVSTLYHTVWLYDSAGNLKQVLLDDKQNAAPDFSIAPGSYVFCVEAYNGAGRHKTDLAAVGSSGIVQIKSGANGTISIPMHASSVSLVSIAITTNPTKTAYMASPSTRRAWSSPRPTATTQRRP